MPRGVHWAHPPRLSTLRLSRKQGQAVGKANSASIKSLMQ